MSERFFVETPIAAETAQLTGPEVQHLAKVMRAKVGDEVTLFDGSGAEFRAQIERLGRSEAELRILERREVDRELPRELTLAVALPKGDRQQFLVEKLTELGATRLVPLVTRRGVAQPVDSALARLRRRAIEASKQCGRNRLLEIAPAENWGDFVTTRESAARLVAHPTPGETKSAAARLAELPADRPLVVAVGPEGGFSDDEIAAALAHGWQPLALGPRILRVETAAIAVAALVAGQ